MHCRLNKKPGKKARKKKTPNVNNALIVKASDPSHKSIVSKTQTIATNSITNSTNSEIPSTPVTISSRTAQCNNDCIVETSSSKEIFNSNELSSVFPLSQEVDVKSTRMIIPSVTFSNDIPVSVVGQEVDDKSTRTVNDTISNAPSNDIPLSGVSQVVDDKSSRKVNDTISNGSSNDIPLSIVGQKVDGKSTRLINDTVNDDALSNNITLVRENDEAINTTNSLGEDMMGSDTQANVPAEISVDIVDNCDHITDAESQTLSISDGEILSGSEEGNPPMTGSCKDAIVPHDDKVSSRQPAGRSRPQGNHQRNHGHHSGRHSASGLRNYQVDEKSNAKPRHSQHQGHSGSNNIHQSSSCGSHDSSKRLHHNSNGSHDSSKRLHRTSGGSSYDTSLHHSSSSSSKLHHTSSRSHDPSKTLHHESHSSESHDSKSHSSGSHDSLRLHHTSSRSHDSSETLHHKLSGSRDSLRRLHHSSSDSHSSSRRHSSSGSQNSSRTSSSQCNSTSDQRRTSEHGSGPTRGPKRRYSNHGSSRDTPMKRKRST